MVPEHERRLTLFLTVTFAFVGFIIKGFMYYQTLQEAEKGTSMPTVTVAIISDREHFELRKAIRETWLSDRGTARAQFVLGSKSCNIHPKDRLDNYSCEFFYPNITTGNFRLAQHTPCPDGEVRVAVGLSFGMRYPGILRRLGSLAFLTASKVYLIDAVTKNVLAEVEIGADDGVYAGYRYRDLRQPIALDKGFEGILMLTGNVSTHCGSSIFLHSDAVEFKRIYYDHMDENSLQISSNTLSGVSGEFRLTADQELTTINVLQRRRQWLEHLETLNRRISAESAKYKDIVTVDTIETYRNLPRKVSEAFAHFSKQPLTFLVKVDDDVVLDLSRLKHILTTSLATTRVIWGKPRRSFPVSIYGKWAENVNFPSPFYPDFPCGAVYVLSKDLVQFVAKNKAMLHHFQGEDVSVGTWLLGMAPQYLGETLFSCSSVDCSGNVLNRAEVKNADEMRRIWDAYMQNKTMCV